jgi:hypothetical protein
MLHREPATHSPSSPLSTTRPRSRPPAQQPSRPVRGLALALVLAAAGSGSGGCAFHALGRAPDDLDLQNDGSAAAQSQLYRTYEVVYDNGLIRRPGADPARVAADIHVPKVDDVSTRAWSDDAFNYLSTSDAAAELMEDPAVAFDEFAHSGNGELVLIGLGIGAGLVGGGVTWFVPTTVRDGVSDEEMSQLYLDVSAGFFAGATLGLLVSAAYTYIVPAVTTPLAAPKYRAAARAFNDDLDARITAASPHADDADHDGGAATGKDGAPCPDDCDTASCPRRDGAPCPDDCDTASCPRRDGGAPAAAPAPAASSTEASSAAGPRPVDAPAAPAAPPAPR